MLCNPTSLHDSLGNAAQSCYTTLWKEHDVIFCPIEEESNLKWTQSQAGKRLVPPSAWNTACSKLGWQMKWTLNGLQPQRPLAIMTQDVTLPPQKALILH